MRFPYLVIIILILILGISGCAQKKLDQSDDPLYLNNTNNSLEVPETQQIMKLLTIAKIVIVPILRFVANVTKWWMETL